MNCQECEATFSDLFDGETRVAGETPGREAARARAHLAVCPRCGESYRAFEEAMGALRREPLEAVPEGFAAGVIALAAAGTGAGGSVIRMPPRHRGRLPAAAALLLAAGLAAGFVVGRSMGRQESSQALAELDAKLRGEREGSAGALSARQRLDGELAALRRSVPTLQEDLRRAAGDLASLRQERDSLASALDGSRREAEETTRDLRRRLEEAAALAALPRMGPEAAAPPSSGGAPSGREPPLASGATAQRSVASQAVVALDRRDSRGGSLTIDVRGPDEQVIPDLLLLSESREPELARLARRLLRERSPGLPAEDAAGAAGRSEGSAGSGVLLGSLGGLVEKAAEGLGVREPRPEAPVALGSAEDREVERLKRYWTARGIGDDSGASTMKL